MSYHIYDQTVPVHSGTRDHWKWDSSKPVSTVRVPNSFCCYGYKRRSLITRTVRWQAITSPRCKRKKERKKKKKKTCSKAALIGTMSQGVVMKRAKQFSAFVESNHQEQQPRAVVATQDDRGCTPCKETWSHHTTAIRPRSETSETRPNFYTDRPLRIEETIKKKRNEKRIVRIGTRINREKNLCNQETDINRNWTAVDKRAYVRLRMWRWSFSSVRKLHYGSYFSLISNLESLSSSETGANRGIRSWKNHFSEWACCQKAIGGSYFKKKWRAATLHPGLELDNFNTRLKSGIFKCISSLYVSFFWGRWLVFSDKGVVTMALTLPLDSPTLFVFTSIVYGKDQKFPNTTFGLDNCTSLDWFLLRTKLLSFHVPTRKKETLQNLQKQYLKNNKENHNHINSEI
jgi:hypothetical protein